MKNSTEDRFWAKVDRSGGPDACWEWKAYRLKDGYGRFWASSRLILAHRYAWELEHGPIPGGLHVCHRCDNPGCCNPAHLFLGTHADNMRDMGEKGRGNKACGERHGRAKLTSSKVAEIRSLCAAGGTSQAEIGRRFGISYSQVSRIVRGKEWG